MSDFISFQCFHCQARIKAPIQLLGQTRPCPKCGNTLVVRPQAPSEEGPILVLDETPPHAPLPTW